jgi:hypothetical protein
MALVVRRRKRRVFAERDGSQHSAELASNAVPLLSSSLKVNTRLVAAS